MLPLLVHARREGGVSFPNRAYYHCSGGERGYLVLQHVPTPVACRRGSSQVDERLGCFTDVPLTVGLFCSLGLSSPLNACRPPLVRQPTGPLPPPPLQPQAVPSQDAQVIQVLTTAAQRVAQEAQSQVVAAGVPSEPGHELKALAKQQHVLTVTAQAVDNNTVSAQGNVAAQPSSVLAAAAQQVVLQAARQVAADRSAIAAAQFSAGYSPQPTSAASQVTVNEVSAATQSAVAQAVELTGHLSSEVDVLMTASSLLQAQHAHVQAQVQQAQVQPRPVAPAPLRHHGSFSVPAPLPIPLSHPPEGNVAPVPIADLTMYSQHS